MYTVCGNHKVMYVRGLYGSVQWVYENVISIKETPFVWCTVMQAFGFIHLLYEAPRVLIAVVHS